ncbi:hypothetical protein B296_00023255 [Ensete ventricosum]|uniref:Uncharacterized protein n=1 Tax=Ensete ventricosum TaxID=4639 RepID=A0A427AJJ8_ENSVE|nr:hypothetical protein B296_00023255 [Ensete ventricosum]
MISKCVKLSSQDGLYSAFELALLDDVVLNYACYYAAGMLWSGEAPDAKALEENMGAYCNIIHGFVLLCHGSTVGAGPTLHASIYASAKQVVDCSLALLREAVSYGAYHALLMNPFAVLDFEKECNTFINFFAEPHDHEKRFSISQLAGTVWEACAALKKTPTTNCTAVGRAITQVAVSLKDVLREMGELKCAASDDSGDRVSDKAAESTSDEEGDLAVADIGDDLSAEEMAIAQLIISVVSDTLAVIKELIRFITGLLKSSCLKISSKESTDSLEKLLSYCREMGQEVNEMGACVYPPQEIPQMKSSANKMHRLVDKMHIEVTSLEGSPDGVYGTFKQLESSLGNLQHGLGGDLTTEMGRLAV